MESDPASRHGSRLDHDSPFERRVRILCLLIAAPAFVLAAVLVWRAGFSGGTAAALLGGAQDWSV